MLAYDRMVVPRADSEYTVPCLGLLAYTLDFFFEHTRTQCGNIRGRSLATWQHRWHLRHLHGDRSVRLSTGAATSSSHCSRPLDSTLPSSWQQTFL